MSMPWKDWIRWKKSCLFFTNQQTRSDRKYCYWKQHIWGKKTKRSVPAFCQYWTRNYHFLLGKLPTNSLISLRAQYLIDSFFFRWCRTRWVWFTSQLQGPKMLWWGLWWGALKWPGQQSVEVSWAPWAPGWARWSAMGWAWPWADRRNGLTRTCHSLSRSWVSSYPKFWEQSP